MSTTSARRLQAFESRTPDSVHGASSDKAKSDQESERSSSREGSNSRPDDVLERIRTRLTRQVGPQRFERYFDRQARLTVTPAGVDVTVPSRFMANLLDRQFGAVLREVIRAEWPGPSDVSEQDGVRGVADADDADGRLHYRVDTGAFLGTTTEEIRPESVRRSNIDTAAPRGRERSTSGGAPAGFVAERFRFETFVVGASNRVAYGAAVKLAESTDARDFNRLFIQGPCGLGKTHLLHATMARFKERNPTAVVRYITAEEFTNEYITSVREGKIDAFRKRYRRVDLLCLDDVHFFARKDKTQSELQHTFDALDLEGARLVLASDELPRNIASLSEHLVSRFLSGAVVRLDPPERELRERLVKAIAARRGLSIEDGAAAALAQHAGAVASSATGVSVRELEGAMTQVEAMLRLSTTGDAGSGDSSGAISASLVHRTLGRGAETSPVAAAVRSGRPIPFQVVIAEVCKELNVELSAFTGTGRHPRVVLARCVCGHLGRELTTLSFPEIARSMGRPTHSTIISGCKRLKARLSAEAENPRDLSQEFGSEYAGLTLAGLLDRTIRSVVSAAARV